MPSILFYDPYCPVAYDNTTLKQQALGGTEATVIRIAEKLGEKCNVVVAQEKKETHTTSKYVQYIPFAPFLLKMDWDAVVVIRTIEKTFDIRNANKKVPIWLWLHDLIDIRVFPFVDRLKKNNIGVITVSDFHKKQFENLQLYDPYLIELPKVLRIYNPIEDALRQDQTSIEKTKLLFSSSTWKGLHDTLWMFKRLKDIQADFELFITNPGYNNSEVPPINGVINLGPLTHQENIAHMRSSLALFQINHVRAETFGLVLAEANAVGTPVLTHPLGAAVEVLQNKKQLINTYNKKEVIETIFDWRFGTRPQVNIPAKFRLSHIIKEWETILFSKFSQ